MTVSRINSTEITRVYWKDWKVSPNQFLIISTVIKLEIYNLYLLYLFSIYLTFQLSKLIQISKYKQEQENSTKETPRKIEINLIDFALQNINNINLLSIK